MEYPGIPNTKAAGYSPAKTGIKGGKETVAGSVAGLIAMWIAARIWGADIAAEQLALYVAILVGPVSGGLMMLRNIVREIARRYGFDFRNILPMLLAGVVASGLMGCAFSGFKEITQPTVDADGVIVPGAKMVQRTFVFTPPFATHAGEQRFSYEAQPDGGWKLTNGQEGEAQGGDPTALINAIGAIYASAMAARPPQNNQQTGFTPGQITELERIFEILGDRINLIGKRVGVLEAPLATE